MSIPSTSQDILPPSTLKLSNLFSSSLNDSDSRSFQREARSSFVLANLTDKQKDMITVKYFLAVEADKSGVMNPTQRLIGTIFGMKVIVSNNVTSTLAYIIDAKHAFIIADKRPLTIERYSDVARDSQFVVITQRFATAWLRSEATSEITTT